MTDDVGHVREIDLAWGNVLSVWWLLAWRTVVGVILLAVIYASIYGTIAGFIAGMQDEPVSSDSQSIDTIAGLIVYLLWGMVVVRMALRKKYRVFKIAPVPREH